MVLITIVDVAYRPTYNWGGHIVVLDEPWSKGLFMEGA